MPRFTKLVLGFFAAILCGSLFAADTPPTIQSLNKMPLAFTKNIGQWDDRVLFRAGAGGATMWFTKEGVTYQFTRRIPSPPSPLPEGEGWSKTGEREMGHSSESWNPGVGQNRFGFDASDPRTDTSDSIDQLILTAKFVGANPNPGVFVEGQLEYKCNYFLGNDPAKWHTDVPNYEAITLKDIYPGIDLKYSGDVNGQAAYEFMATAEADRSSQGENIPLSRGVRGVSFSQIKVEYEGAESTSLDDAGNLILHTKWGDMIAAMNSPRPVGEGSGVRAVLSSSATCAWWTSLSTTSPPDLAHGDVCQARASLGTSSVGLVYSTYLGGGSIDWGERIAVDGSGNAYVTGLTLSTNFPTLNPYQTDQGDFDVFVTKLSSAGNSLIYSTYLGGENYDRGNGIAVDASGYAYVTGTAFSDNFPTQNPCQGAFQGYVDVFVTKLSSTGNSLIYSTYLGGTGADQGYAIAVDIGGNAFVTGYTESSDFPTQNPCDASYNGGTYYGDVFVTKLSSAGNSLIYSTYLGGTGDDQGYAITVDIGCNAFVTGYTESSDFPTLKPYQATLSGYLDAFVTKLSNSGNSLIYSTYLGGENRDNGSGIAVDGSGNAYVTGLTTSSNFPTLNPYQATSHGYQDAFVTELYFDGANDVSDEMTPISLPEKPALDQNYPNPFNPSTEICFDIPKPSFVSLDIYDVLGRLVTTLIDEQLTAGSKRVRWDGRDDTGAEVASGVYFYRLKTGDHVEVKKMVLLK